MRRKEDPKTNNRIELPDKEARSERTRESHKQRKSSQLTEGTRKRIDGTGERKQEVKHEKPKATPESKERNETRKHFRKKCPPDVRWSAHHKTMRTETRKTARQ